MMSFHKIRCNVLFTSKLEKRIVLRRNNHPRIFMSKSHLLQFFKEFPLEFLNNSDWRNQTGCSLLILAYFSFSPIRILSEEETVADICKNSGRNSAHKSNWLRLHIFAYYLAESYVESANFLWVVKFILLEYNNM